MKEFQMIDNPKTPTIIKPMTILHDKLVKGYDEERDLKVDKLIVNLQKSISKQITALVDMEDCINISNMVLVKCLKHIRDMIDNGNEESVDFLLEQTNELRRAKKYSDVG
jgi:hypothetical protein|tara:strand:- start:71 stop:400 length:330 start_codon:yes stop_codon:yes gene_type:complete